MYNLENICLEVCEIARITGSFIRQERITFSNKDIEHKGHNDLVSYVDKVAEQRIISRLQKIIPESSFLAEENTVTVKEAKWQWIIDPLDGTTNFIHGLPCYCISIALMQDNQLVLGVVYEINLDECFYAWEGGIACMNGKKIQVSSVPTIQESLIATGFPYTNYSRMKPYMEVFDYCLQHSHGLRRLGSAAVDLAYVACGRMEAFYEYGLNAWDVAAGAFIVKQAGGEVCDFSGGSNFVFGREIIASNRKVHTEFLNVVKEKFSGN